MVNLEKRQGNQDSKVTRFVSDSVIIKRLVSISTDFKGRAYSRGVAATRRVRYSRDGREAARDDKESARHPVWAKI